MLMSDLKHNFVKTYTTFLDRIDMEKLRALFKEMELEAEGLLQSELISEDLIFHVYSLDMRYVKQYHEVNVEITKEEIEKGNIEPVAEKFHPEHNRLFGYSLEKEGTPVELINLRLLSIGKTAKPEFTEEDYDGESPAKAFKKKRKAYLPIEKEFVDVDVYDGHRIRHGNTVEGPALIEQVNTTTFVTPEYSVVCDRYGSYTMYLKKKEKEVLEKLGI
jgi:N-methylhydantoinase A